MKKILALVLSLMMILTVASAFAANGSPEQPSTKIVTDDPNASAKFIDDTEASKKIIEEFKAAQANSELPAAIKDKVPEGFKNVTEMVTAQFDGDVAGISKDVILNVMFETQYAKDQKVVVLIGVLSKDPVEWQACDGIVKEDGSIDVTLPASLLGTLKTDPFMICVITE